VYQLILLPAEVAFKLEEEPLLIEDWVAVTDDGSEGKANTVTFAASELVQPFAVTE